MPPVTCAACGAPREADARFCGRCGAAAVVPAADHPGPATVLDLGWGRAVVGTRIGDGGMGTVYRGWLYYDPAGPQAGLAPTEVAIKVLLPDVGADERTRRLFLGEAEALRLLSHPNIVRFYGLWDQGQG